VLDDLLSLRRREDALESFDFDEWHGVLLGRFDVPSMLGSGASARGARDGRRLRCHRTRSPSAGRARDYRAPAPDQPAQRGGLAHPGERRIVDLAAAGGTNREIAQTLFVTEKTVETHLGRAFRKLNITSRRQIKDVLVSAGG
jgi:DNA-binding CsgD family transcriptional regulator